MTRYDGEERRRAISLNGLPGWAQVISVLGFPIVVALILLGMFTGNVGSPLTRVEALVERHMKGEDERLRLLRTMCRHQSIAMRQNPDDCDR